MNTYSVVYTGFRKYKLCIICTFYCVVYRIWSIGFLSLWVFIKKHSDLNNCEMEINEMVWNHQDSSYSFWVTGQAGPWVGREVKYREALKKICSRVHDTWNWGDCWPFNMTMIKSIQLRQARSAIRVSPWQVQIWLFTGGGNQSPAHKLKNEFEKICQEECNNKSIKGLNASGINLQKCL